MKIIPFCQNRSTINETRWQPAAARNVKSDNNLNEWMFNGVVVDDEIEEVGDKRSVECLLMMSGECGGHGVRSAACMHFRRI